MSLGRLLFRRLAFLSLVRSLLYGFLLGAVLTSATARSWTPAQLPNPQQDPGGVCGRRSLKSAVCDPDGYLSQSDGDTIDGLINFINKGEHGFKQYPCPGGSSGPQMAVAIVTAMEYSGSDKQASAYEFARKLHDEWGVGDPHCQNGIVLFFAIRDRSIGISIGAGVKKVFTNAMVPVIIASIRDKMRAEKYGPAIIDAVTSIGNILSGGPPPKADDDSFVPSWVIFLFMGVFVVFLLINCSQHARSQSRYSQCKKMLARLDNDRARASRQQYVATSCPICLEDFEENAPPNAPSTADHDNTLDEWASEHASLVGNQPSSDSKKKKSGENTSADGNGSANRPGVPNKGKTQRRLPCGHNYHEDCILSWIAAPERTTATCPVCRRPVEPRPDSSVEPRVRASEPVGWDMYDDEYRFRMRRAHHFYPDFISWSMMDSWERHRRDNNRPMATSPAFVNVDPAVVAADARESGGGGSSFTYGGGSSAGGGGGGGSW